MIKTSLLLSAVLATVVSSSQAGELYTPEQYQAPASSLTRAEVKQSVLRASKAGELQHNDIDQPAENTVVFGKTRAQVKSEVLAARATGGLEHNDVDQPSVATGSVLNRQEVRNEAIAARKSAPTAPGRNTVEY